VPGAEGLPEIGQQLLVQGQRRGRVAAHAGAIRDVGTGGQGVGVAGAKYLLLVRQQPLEQRQRGKGVSALSRPECNMDAGGKDVGMARALDPGAEAEFKLAVG
jgi:hypothetical protein